jgi:hypothetical protein
MIVHLMLSALIFGCSLFGFEFKFHFQTQRHLLCFSSLFFPLFSLLWAQPGQPVSLPSPSSLFAARPSQQPFSPALFFLPRAARSPPAHGLSPSFFPSRARGPLPRSSSSQIPTRGPLPHPGPTRSFPTLSLWGEGPACRDPLPRAAPDSGSSPARPRADIAASASVPHAQERSRPYLSATSTPAPLNPSYSRHLALKTLARRAPPPSPFRAAAAPPLRCRPPSNNRLRSTAWW